MVVMLPYSRRGRRSVVVRRSLGVVVACAACVFASRARARASGFVVRALRGARYSVLAVRGEHALAQTARAGDHAELVTSELVVARGRETSVASTGGRRRRSRRGARSVGLFVRGLRVRVR